MSFINMNLLEPVPKFIDIEGQRDFSKVDVNEVRRSFEAKERITIDDLEYLIKIDKEWHRRNLENDLRRKVSEVEVEESWTKNASKGFFNFWLPRVPTSERSIK